MGKAFSRTGAIGIYLYIYTQCIWYILYYYMVVGGEEGGKNDDDNNAEKPHPLDGLSNCR